MPMQRFGAALALLAVLAPAAQASEALAKAKGCLACHQTDRKAVGPTYRDVARRYAGQGDALAKVAGADGHATLMRASQEVRACTPPFQPPSPAVAALSERVRRQFDPQGIFNPGRMQP